MTAGTCCSPEKIVQIVDQRTQARINCLPATMLEDKVCGVKWVSVFPENPKEGLQNLAAVVVLSEIEHGFPVAVMDGTMASNMRVGAVGGIAAKYLAREDAEAIGFIGAGEQAKMHLLAIKSVRPSLKVCRVSSRTVRHEIEFVDQMQPILPDMEIVAMQTNHKAAIEGAEVLVTATSAQAPLLKADWIKPGSFYSHVGGWEDEFGVAQQSDKIVCDDWETVKHRTQTLSRMYKEGELTDDDVYGNLVSIVAGEKPGRERDDERVYFNAVGLAFVDLAIALAMYRKAQEHGFGQRLTLQETTIFEHPQISDWVRM